MVYDSDYREAPCAAVDTAYPLTQQGADTPGAFIVPTTATRITEIRIGVGGVTANADVVAGLTTGVHLYGSGIQLAEGWFAGPMLVVSGAAATAGGFQSKEPQIYKTNISVKGGGLFNADGFIWGEDIGTAHLTLCIVYDGVPGKIVDADCREVDVGAAANTLVTLANRGAAVAEGDFRPGYSRIVEVNVGVAVDPTGHATDSLNIMPAFHLSGPGLLHAGNYKWIGNCGINGPDTDVAGDQTWVGNLTRYECDIALKRGDAIRAQSQMLESIEPGHAVICLCYG